MNKYTVYLLFEKGYRKEDSYNLAIKYHLTAKEENALYDLLEEIENNTYKNLMEV